MWVNLASDPENLKIFRLTLLATQLQKHHLLPLSKYMRIIERKGKRKVAVLVLALVVFLSGTAVAYHYGNKNGNLFVEKAASGISGSVLLGPTCPVMKFPPDKACADKPYQTRLAVTTSDQARVIKEFASDANGKFTVDVPPGEYTIRSSGADNVLPHCASNDLVKVESGKYTDTNVSCDTGIR